MFEAAPARFYLVHCRLASRPAVQAALLRFDSSDVRCLVSVFFFIFFLLFSRSHQLGMLEGGPTAVGNFSRYATLMTILI
jgi:hypothetical protein